MSPAEHAEAEQPFSRGDELDLARWLRYGERELHVHDLEEAGELVEAGSNGGEI